MWLVFVILIAGLGTASASERAATVNGGAISLQEIDAPLSARIAELREELGALAARTTDRLIDEHLQTLTPSAPSVAPTPVTDDDIRTFRASHAEDFEGPFAPGGLARHPDVQHAAIRHYLQQKAHEAAEAEARRRRRSGQTIELFLPTPQELEQALSPERTVARVDAVAIRAAEFERAAALRLYRLRGELYHERRRSLEAAIEELLLWQEAQRRGIPKEALLTEMSGKATVNSEEVHAFIEAERAAGRTAPTAKRARPYLEFRKRYAQRKALLDQLRAAAHVEILLQEPTVPRLPVVEAGAPALGASTGPKLIVYTNYRCPPCRAVHKEINALLAMDQTVRVVFRDFIPAYDPVATEGAFLARCAAQLGAFERMRGDLLSREPPTFGLPWYTDNALPSLTSKLGVDPTAFSKCLSSTEVREAIERDTAQAREFGFEAAPAFVAEGIPLSGMQSANGLAHALHQGRVSSVTP